MMKLDRRETRYRGRWATLTAVALVLAVGFGAAPTATAVDGEGELEFTDVAEQTREFIGYARSIELTPEQEEVKRAALEELPAPCCSEYSAYTCCCECNMAMSIWGLSNLLIAERGHDAAAVRGKVEEWIDFINPAGFTGDVCSTGGCFRPFDDNGCGGMDQGRIITG